MAVYRGNISDITGFNLTADDYAAYAKKLAEYAHTLTTQEGRPLMFGQKNAGQLLPDLIDIMDFAVIEECRDNYICCVWQPYIKQGKPVFELEYPKSVRHSTNITVADYNKYCDNEYGNNKYSLLIKHASEQVNGWGMYCDNGLTGGGFDTSKGIEEPDERK
jgi:hypothetical protein